MRSAFTDGTMPPPLPSNACADVTRVAPDTRLWICVFCSWTNTNADIEPAQLAERPAEPEKCRMCACLRMEANTPNPWQCPLCLCPHARECGKPCNCMPPFLSPVCPYLLWYCRRLRGLPYLTVPRCCGTCPGPTVTLSSHHTSDTRGELSRYFDSYQFLSAIFWAIDGL